MRAEVRDGVIQRVHINKFPTSHTWVRPLSFVLMLHLYIQDCANARFHSA